MNKSAKDMDLSSIITQVAKEEDGVVRPSPVAPPLSSTSSAPSCHTNKERQGRKRRVLSALLCCMGLGRRTRRNRGPSTYNAASPNSEPDHERIALNDNNAQNESPDKYLLPPVHDAKTCLVIDLDETLVHSSFKPVANADFIVPVEIDGTVHQVYVTKRPHVDEFLNRVGQLYECVLFTASLAKYADPVANLLDPNNIFRARLFRESCTYYNGNYIKDLSRLGRNVRKVIIIDNSPVSYIFHQENAVPVSSWFDDVNDTELLTLIPIFERLAVADDVVPALQDMHHRRTV